MAEGKMVEADVGSGLLYTEANDGGWGGAVPAKKGDELTMGPWPLIAT